MYKDYCIHNLEYAKKLRKSFILRFDNDEAFLVLVPRESEEEFKR